MISYCPSWYKIGSSKLLVKAVAQMNFSSRLSFIHLTQTFRLSLPSTSVVTAPRHNWQILAQCMFWFLQWVDENHNAKPSDQWHKLIHSAEQVRLGHMLGKRWEGAAGRAGCRILLVFLLTFSQGQGLKKCCGAEPEVQVSSQPWGSNWCPVDKLILHSPNNCTARKCVWFLPSVR